MTAKQRFKSWLTALFFLAAFPNSSLSARAEDNVDPLIDAYLTRYRAHQYSEAAGISLSAIEAAGRQQGTTRLFLAGLRIDRAEILKAAGQYYDAELALKASISDIEAATVDPGHAPVSAALLELTDVLRLENKFDDAQYAYRRAINLNPSGIRLRGGFESGGPRLIRLDGAMVNSVFDFIEHAEREPSGFGLYTYVLFPTLGTSEVERAHLLIDELLQTTRNQNKIEFDRRRLNIFLLPVKNERQVAARSLATDVGISASEKSGPLVDSYYNFDYAVEILDRICVVKTAIPSICKTDLSRGPYLITLAKTLAAHETDPSPYLVLDLGGISPESFAIYLSALKEQLKKSDISDTQRVPKLRLAALNYINSAGDSIAKGLPSVERVLELLGWKPDSVDIKN